MGWPPAGSDPGAVLLYLIAMWLLLIWGPVAVWAVVYYRWLKPRWEPHFREAEEVERKAAT